MKKCILTHLINRFQNVAEKKELGDNVCKALHKIINYLKHYWGKLAVTVVNYVSKWNVAFLAKECVNFYCTWKIKGWQTFVHVFTIFSFDSLLCTTYAEWRTIRYLVLIRDLFFRAHIKTLQNLTIWNIDIS